jgi:Membrane proteins related to metalloendopeptidases
MTWPRLLHRALPRRGARVATLVLTITSAAAMSAPAPPPEPAWRAPLDGPIRVVRRFDPPALPWLSGHRGVDLAAEPGARVRAAGAGRVGYAGNVAGRGVVTILHEGGLRTTYLPVRALVERGAPVRPGDVIGRLEPVPGHCPRSCLHWGLLRGDQYLDPLLLLGTAQIRLLPFWHVPFGSPAPPRRPPVSR